MRKTLLLVCALFLSVSMFAGSITGGNATGDDGTTYIQEDLSSIADKFASITYELSFDGDLSGGLGGAIILNSENGGWDSADWGNEGSDKPITAAINGTQVLVTRTLGEHFKGNAGPGGWFQAAVQHYWGPVLTYVGFKAYDAEGNVILSKGGEPEEPQPAGKVWDFSVWTLTVADADANLVLDGTKRFDYKPATSAEELKRENGTVIEETKGLLLTAGATNKLRLNFTEFSLQLNGKDIQLNIPAEAGDQVTVIAKSGNKDQKDRGFAITEGGTFNAEKSSTFISQETGNYIITDTSEEAIFVIEATGNVNLKTVTGGINVLKITVGPAGEPEPTPNAGSWDFEADALEATYPNVAWNAEALVATVVANPFGEGQVLKVNNENWDSGVKFTGVTLPEGKTLADIKEIKFDIALASTSSDIVWKSLNYWIGADAAAFVPGTKTGQVSNIIQSDELDTWLPKSFVPELTDELKALTAFDLAMGLHLNAAQLYYLDNITLVLNDGTYIDVPEAQASSVRTVDGGIEIVTEGQRTAVYSIDGRLVADTYNNYISLQGGIYIVKTGAEKAVKVIVK